MTPANVDNVFRSMMAIIRSTFASALQNFLAGSAALPIANGGTGATSAATALTALGALDDDYRDLVFAGKSGAFNIDNTERGYCINYTGSAAACTIRPQSSHAVNTGAVYVIRNGGSGALTMTRGSGVILQPNGGASADAVMAVGGVATLINWGSDTWTISGSGIS
jgi:hypothetical protein